MVAAAMDSGVLGDGAGRIRWGSSGSPAGDVLWPTLRLRHVRAGIGNALGRKLESRKGGRPPKQSEESAQMAFSSWETGQWQ